MLRGLGRRTARTAAIVFTHRWIKRRDPLAGVGHALIFYGFLVLFAGTTILGLQDDVARPLFGFDFWRGSFYLGYSLVLDVFGFGLAVGLAIMAVNRLRHPRRLDYRRPDREEDRTGYVVGDWVFVGLLFFLTLSGFLLEAFRIAQTNPPFETWSPVGWAVGRGFSRLGMTAQQASTAHFATWWTPRHRRALVRRVDSVHQGRAHAGGTRERRRARRSRREAPATLARERDAGASRVRQDRRSHVAASGLARRVHEMWEVPRRLPGERVGVSALATRRHPRPPSSSPSTPGPSAPIGERIRPDTIWSCTQCMACVEICPVGIEHVPIINQIRRRLVEDGELDSMLQTTLEAVYKTGNSFGEPKRKRPRWTRELGFEVKDIRREPAELLWFVGDYASFDARNQRATQALARILREADTDFGILFDAERTAGCDVRRAGEEGLWAALAEENVKTIGGCDFDRIFSSDPHTFHTLRNEYPQHGGSWSVVHHSQLLLELLASGALEPRRELGYRVTYHDPCTLGRYNGVYDAPRRVLEAIGCDLVEMPRNRDNSFCCGAGGGRIWMKELKQAGARRPSEQRIDEAVALGALDYFVVCCPKDVTMYEDAIKTAGHQGALELRELSELVLEALDLPAAPVAVAEEEVAR